MLILMLILGPFSGWYGPTVVLQIRSYLAPPSLAKPPITPNLNQQQQLNVQRMRALIAKIAEQEANAQVRRDWEAHRQPDLLLKRDGTFNMRYHLPDSER